MAVEVKETEGGKVLEVHASGKLSKQDYGYFVPGIENLINQWQDPHAAGVGRLPRLGVGALWEDIKFDMKHFRDIEQLAVVGERKWQHGMAVFCKPFTSAKVQYFDIKDVDKAQQWITE